jgi:hypothetical protein
MGVPKVREIQMTDETTFVGETLDGLPHGTGVLKGPIMEIHGNFSNGVLHGSGVMVIGDKYVYQSEWVNGIVVYQRLVQVRGFLILL